MPVSILLFVQEFLLFIKLLLSDRVFSSFIESKKQNLYEKKMEIINLKSRSSKP